MRFKRLYTKEGMGNENYIRICGAGCKTENECCNWCEYIPKDMSKHKHKYFLKNNELITSFWKKISGGEYRKLTYKCPCGQIQLHRVPTHILNPPKVLK